MALTPDKIAAFNKITGGNVDVNSGMQPLAQPAQPSRADEIKAIAAQAQQSAQPLGAVQGFTTGAVKGALGTFVESPIRSIAGIAATGEAVRGKGTEEQLVSKSKELDALTNQLATATGEQKTMLQQQIRQKMSELQGKSEAFKQQTGTAQQLLDVEQGKTRLSETLKPQTTAESLGYGAEKLAEFFIPSGKALEASRVARGVVEGSKMAKFGELTKAFGAEGVDKIAGALARGATYTGKILGPAAVEALTAAGVSMAQTRDPEEAVRNAEWAGAITGGIGVLSSMGNPFVDAAKRIYRAALKPSTAGGIAGAERAARAVETGLDEGIKLTEKGINKTVATIDAMESQLDDAIKAAAAQGDKTSVPTAPLREYINEAKQWFQYLADTDAAQKALDDIDNIYDNFVNVYGENVPIDVAQKIKTSTYRYLKEAFNEIAAPAKEGSKQLVRGLKEGIVENAPAVGDINARLRKLYEFDEVLEKSVGRIQNRNLLGLGTKGIAVAAGATGNPLLGALAFANEFITSPGIGSSAAIKLYRLGKVLNTMDASLAERAIESPTMANVIRRITRNYGDMSQEEQKAAQGILGWFERTKKQATELLSDRRGFIDFDAEVFPKGKAAATAKTTAGKTAEIEASKDIKIVPATPDNQLLSVHNLNEQKLAFADRIGGLANPSMAVIDPKITPFESYGDITLVAPKALIEGEKTFLADAYSARFPSIRSTINYGNMQKLNEDLKPFYDSVGDRARKIIDNEDIVREVENNTAVALKFLREKGITPSPEGPAYYHSQIINNKNLNSQFQDFLNNLYEKYGVKEYLFDGYTNMGRPRYKEVSLQEASKIMKKQKDEGWNYGLGTYRAKAAPVKTATKEIRAEAKRLLPKEDFEKVKESYEARLEDLQQKLEPFAKNKDSNRFTEYDRQMNTIGSVLMGEKDAMTYFRSKYGDNVSESVMNDVMNFKKDLKNMPTEYFETKFQKPVGLNQFSYALVPENTSDKALRTLESHGMKIIKYKEGEKQKELLKLLSDPTVAYGLAGGIGVAGMMQQKD